MTIEQLTEFLLMEIERAQKNYDNAETAGSANWMLIHGGELDALINIARYMEVY